MVYVVAKWSRQVVDTFLSCGEAPIVLIDDNDIAAFSDEMASYHGLQKIAVDFDDLRSVTTCAGEIRSSSVRVDGVFNFLESTQYSAAIIGDLLETPRQMLPVALRTRDKRVMKASMAAASIPVARSVPITPTNLHSTFEVVVASVGLPAIIKPTDGRGSKGVWQIQSKREFKLWFESAEKTPQVHWLAEEMITGDEYHVDTIWLDGEQKYTFIGKYERPPRLVAGSGRGNATVYLPARSGDTLQDEATAMCKKIALALGIHRGVTHAEFFVTPAGKLIFSEVASRPAGGPHDGCIKALVGEGLRQLGVRALLGQFDTIPTSLTTSHLAVGFVNLCPTRDGRIASLPNRDALMAKGYVHDVMYSMSVGQQYTENGACTWCVMPIVGQNTVNECYETFADLRRQFPCLIAE